MLYLNTRMIEEVGIDWHRTIDVIEQTVRVMNEGEFAQPIKPYLRYRDPSNRIIAMPAFVGGEVDFSGIKWIASFPKNIKRGIQRAHSVTILNDVATGKAVATFNTAVVSGIRTASVTGLMLRSYQKVRELKDITLGIVGFGPIGRLHLQMVSEVLGDAIAKVVLYDLAGINTEFIPASIKDKTEIAERWEDAYLDADVFITCTVSPQGYIDQKPKENALLVNVSLRDFQPQILDYTQSIIVDEWEEVCRESTDIERMHLERGLMKEQTKSIVDVVCHDAMREFPADQPIMFNPMGMAIFDIATAAYYYREAKAKGMGIELED